MSKIYFHQDDFVINYLKNNPELPYLISYPRTGSHWIRYAMEEYFHKPSLVMVYKYDDATDFTCYHTHGLDRNGTGLTGLEKKDVIYLYRNPVDTVFSMIKHQKQNQDDESLIITHSKCYREHLVKYILKDNFSDKKVILKYENFKEDFASEFEKLCKHLNYDFDKDKIENIIIGLDKEKIKKESTNKYSNIDVSAEYNALRDGFKHKYSDLINEIVFKDNSELKNFL